MSIFAGHFENFCNRLDKTIPVIARTMKPIAARLVIRIRMTRSFVDTPKFSHKMRLGSGAGLT